ncbi:MAG: hypothetical protein [Arizlama microvirus]|nr:MAG: hypothetical protein [Arizlama microvirus]
MVKYNTKVDRIKLHVPDDSKIKRKSRIDLTGFISKENRIINLINAGRRLHTAEGQFDFENEVDINEVECDPTRSKGFDMTDAQTILVNRVYPTIQTLSAKQKASEEQNSQKMPDHPPDKTE